MVMNPGMKNGPQGIPMKNGPDRDPGYDPKGMNEGYETAGQLGSYQTNDGEQWQDPSGAKFFTGFGIDDDPATIARGYLDPHVRENPAYDLVNYKERWTEEKVPDEEDSAGGMGFGRFGAMKDDFEFRQKERKSKGFFTRPHIPTDR